MAGDQSTQRVPQRQVLWPTYPRDRKIALAVRIAELTYEQERYAIEHDRDLRQPWNTGPRELGDSTAERERVMKRLAMPTADTAAASVPAIVTAVRAGKDTDGAILGSVRRANGSEVLVTREVALRVAMMQLQTAAALAGHGRLPLAGRTPQETMDNRWRVFAALFLDDAGLAEAQIRVDEGVKRDRGTRYAEDGAWQRPVKITPASMKRWRQDMRKRGWAL